jgi:hypothetical protein
MCKIDFSVMSLARKIALTIAGLVYILAILGNARHGFVEILSVTLAFGALIAIILIWTK